MTPHPEADTRKLAEKLWQWCWARTLNINLPAEIRNALPDYNELRVYTMPEAPDEPPAIHHIARALQSAADAARRDQERRTLEWVLSPGDGIARARHRLAALSSPSPTNAHEER